MFSKAAVHIVLITVATATIGCGPKAVKRACMSASGGNMLVDGAAMMRLDVYGASAQCVDGLLADGSGTPLLSHTYLAGQPISLDVPPGPHVLVLTTYADEAGTMALGEACTDSTLEAGSQICFDLTVVPAPIQDLSASSCTVTPNSCPTGYYCDGTNCVAGCSSDSDCSTGPDGGTTITPVCDTVTHNCVECVTTSQCGANQVCTNEHCVANCGSTQKLCNGVCIASSTCCSAGDCTTLPSPAACYAGKCSGAGGSCSYAVKTGSVVCGSTCCNAINGTCNGSCVLTCTAGFANCDGDPSNGCETNLGVAGKKLCSNGACVPASTCCTSTDCNTPPAPAACYNPAGTCSGPGGTCTYTENSGSQICNGNTTCCNADNGTCNGTCGLTCTAGFFDCNTNPADGCETACAPANGTGKCASAGGGCAINSCDSGFQNCNGSVSDGCECSTSCCTNPNTGTQDCLVNTHSDGEGHMFSACYPLGAPGSYNNGTMVGTPGTGYTALSAADAATADVSQAGSLIPGLSCTTPGGGSVTSSCKAVSQNNGACTCWTYAASSGNCKDPTDGVMKPCVDFIGHVFASGSKCLCTSVTDASWQ